MPETNHHPIDEQIAPRDNVLLTGFMGTGKTTVGRILAELLNYVFVDTDELIEQRHGPIPQLFSMRGEPHFRELEYDLAIELSDLDNQVISTGGSFLLDPANLAILAKTSRVFCLTATADEIFARIVTDPTASERPLLSGADPYQRIVELLAERAAGYGAFTQISTSDLSPQVIAQEIYAACSI
ncbi:MAG: shikimate kinase [Acidimicrobiales bacterium]